MRVLRLVVDACAGAIAVIEPLVDDPGELSSGDEGSRTRTSMLSGLAYEDAEGTIREGVTHDVLRQHFRHIVEGFLMTAAELCKLQDAALGGDHPDLARTHYDVSAGLKLLLRIAPEAFQKGAASSTSPTTSRRADSPASPSPSSFPPPEWASVSLAQTDERKQRRMHERVRALYSGY